MTNEVSRRRFVGTMGLGAAALAAGAGPAGAADTPWKILGVSCSMRAGQTTAQAVRACLEAARAVAPDRLAVELIDLGGLKIPTGPAAGLALEPGERDDFPPIEAKLADPRLAALIIGTPVYFANMSALCKAFLERCGVFRKKEFALSGKVAGVIAVGAARHGGQELVIQSVQATLLCHEMLVIGEGRPTGHFGGTLWTDGKDDIARDEFGMSTARNLGQHVAKVVLACAAR